jgi:diguanylate cyclase (GGDEF)-like protein
MDAAATALDVGVLLLDSQGRGRAVNPEGARLLDLGIEGLDTTQVFAPGSPFYAEDGSPLTLQDLPWATAGRARNETTALIGRKVSALAFVWIAATVKTISDPHCPGELLTLVSLKDVTQQRRTESQYLRQIANAERRTVVIDARNNHLSQANQQLARQNEALGTLATQDGLTTLKNHQAFQERLREETRRAMRTKEPLSLLILDVDYFKRFNDDYGHPAGDRMLRNLAETMLQTARTTDLVARYGGEEFGIILPETDADGAFIIAERIRVAVETRRWDDRAVTVSIGVSTLRVHESEAGGEWNLGLLPKQMIEEADRAMYKSKRGGRNKVTAYVADPQSPHWLLSAGEPSERPSEAAAGEDA